MVGEQKPIAPAQSKRGLGWPWDNTAGGFNQFHDAISRGKITWLFNWEMWKPQGFPGQLEYVPEVRTSKEADQIMQFLDTLKTPRHFIGFNEPDITDQANMSVQQAAQLWKQYVEPAHHKFNFTLGSPAISNGPNGKKWLQQFFQAIGGSGSVSFVVCHWYGTDEGNFEAFVKDIHATFNKPVWVTEFAYSHLNTAQQVSVPQVLDFMRKALHFLDNADYVQRYAYFGAKTNVGPFVGDANDFSKNGALTEVGRLYCGV